MITFTSREDKNPFFELIFTCVLDVMGYLCSTSEDSYIKSWYVRHKCTANCKEIEIEKKSPKINEL